MDELRALFDETASPAAAFYDSLDANDVVLNQVFFRFPDEEQTERVLQAVQEDGSSWMGGTGWDGRPAIRISVSNWQTSEADVERTLAVYAGQLAAR